MSETQEASIGWGGEFWLSSDSTTVNLVEMVEVVSFSLPQDKTDRVEKTHLKSPNRRREYMSGMVDGGEMQVVLNFRPGSTTDLMLEAAQIAGTERAARCVVPNLGVAAWDYTITAIVTDYDRGTVTAGDKMEATVTLAITGATTSAAHV